MALERIEAHVPVASPENVMAKSIARWLRRVGSRRPSKPTGPGQQLGRYACSTRRLVRFERRAQQLARRLAAVQRAQRAAPDLPALRGSLELPAVGADAVDAIAARGAV